MNSFWTRQQDRISKLGLLRTLGYYAAAAAERAGIGVWLSFEYCGNTVVVDSRNVSFAVVKAMGEWSAPDMEVLRSGYSAAQLEFFNVLFARGDICVAAKWEHSEIACVCWIENTTHYFFAKGRPGFRIHACYTFPSHRGKGLYPQTLAFACKYLRSTTKNAPIFIDTSVLNHASKKGITKAGFVPIGTSVTVRNWKWGWPTRSVSRPHQLEAGKQ